MKKYLFPVLFSIVILECNAQSLMTVAEIYDYDPGDIFIRSVGGYYSPPSYGRTIIINKYYSTLLDTVFYIYNAYFYTPPACQTCAATYDTTYGDTMFYAHLTDTVGSGLGAKIHYWNSFCIDTAGYTGVWVDTISYNPDWCGRLFTRIRHMDNGPQLVDSCYSYFEPYYGYDEYAKGIGQTAHYYNTCSNGFPNCQQGGTLLFYKKGIDSCGTVPVIPLPPNYVNELTRASLFKIAPNPFTDETRLTFSTEQKNVMITILNPLGMVVRTQWFSGWQFILKKKELRSGIYFISVSHEGKSYTSKLVIQ